MGFRLADAMVSVGADTTRLAGDFRFIRSQTDGLVGYMNRAFAAIGVGSTIAEGFKLGAQMEKMSVAFEVMTGSLANSRDMIKELREFSRETPFSFESLAKGARLLLAYSIPAEELIPTLRTLGDITSGTGAQFDRLALAYGQVRSKGRLYAQEVRQFSEAGVPLLAMLTKAYNKSANDMSKMIEKGKIGFRDVDRVLKELTSETGRFSNIMKDLSTTSGAQYVKTLDDIKFLLQDIFTEMAPLTGEVLQSTRAMLSYFTQFFTESQGAFADFVNENAAGLRTMRMNWELTWDLISKQFQKRASEIMFVLERIDRAAKALTEVKIADHFQNSTLGHMYKNAKAYDRWLETMTRALSIAQTEKDPTYFKHLLRQANAQLMKDQYKNWSDVMAQGEKPASGYMKVWEDFLLSLDEADPKTAKLAKEVDELAEKFGMLWAETRKDMYEAERARERRIREVDTLEPGEVGEEEAKKKKKKARARREQRVFDIGAYGAAIQQELFQSEKDKLAEIADVEKDAAAESKKINDEWMKWMNEWRRKNEKGPFDDYNRIEQAQREQLRIRQNQEQRNFYELRRFLGEYSGILKNIGDYIKRAGYLK